MKYKKVKLGAILLLGLGHTGLHAQEAIPASGGNASGSGGSVSYTVGQIVYITNTGTNGSVAEGVQQPYEISMATGLEEAKGISLKCTAYPNPAIDFLILKIENYYNENLMYQLFDINGKLLVNKKITGNETQIEMQNHVPAYYFLKISNNNKELKTFKIIKK